MTHLFSIKSIPPIYDSGLVIHYPVFIFWRRKRQMSLHLLAYQSEKWDLRTSTNTWAVQSLNTNQK